MKDKERGTVRLALETNRSALNFGTARSESGTTVRLREDNGTRTHGLESHNLAL
jgi:hypothetical protein